MIILENREAKPVAYEIPVSVGGGVKQHVARVTRSSDASSRTAQKDLSVIARVFPTTLSLTARGTKGSRSDPLPDNYADVPKIARAIEARRLVRHDSPAPKDEAEMQAGPPAKSVAKTNAPAARKGAAEAPADAGERK